MKKFNFANIIKFLCLIFTIAGGNGLFAQDVEILEIEEEKKGLSFSGSVDTYYRYNLTAKNSFNDGSYVSPATSFANEPGFSLGMVNLICSYDGEKSGIVADLVFGKRGADAVFNSTTDSRAFINQLYIYWNVLEKVTFTFGNFNTFLGYEVISPVANVNYSTSYMFSYGPFSHAGLKMDYAMFDDWSLMLAIMNPTDYTDFNPEDTYTGGFQLGYKSSVFLNMIYGKQKATDTDASFEIDLTAGFDLSDKFYLGVNSAYFTQGEAGFYGVALYPSYNFSDLASLGFRIEYFNEFKNGVGAIGTYDKEGSADAIEYTLTGNFSVGDLTFKPELRFDSMSQKVFTDTDLVLTDSLVLFLLASVYSF